MAQDFPSVPTERGIGLVAMRERAELMGGQIVFSRPPEGGTLVHLTVPREKAEILWKRRSQCCWWMTTAWFGAAFAACSKMRPDMEVVGEAGDGEESVKLAKELHPQVVVMDCALPGMNGLQATREIIEDRPTLRF